MTFNAVPYIHIFTDVRVLALLSTTVSKHAVGATVTLSTILRLYAIELLLIRNTTEFGTLENMRLDFV